jgi:hypothetical protein
MDWEGCVVQESVWSGLRWGNRLCGVWSGRGKRGCVGMSLVPIGPPKMTLSHVERCNKRWRGWGEFFGGHIGIISLSANSVERAAPVHLRHEGHLMRLHPGHN